MKKNQSPLSKKKPLALIQKQMTGDIEALSPNIKSADLKGNMGDFYDEKVFKYYVTRTLEEGFGFGEIHNDRPRTFATLCSDNCVLGVINKKDYLQIFREIQRLKIQEKLDFFSRYFFLQVFEREPYKVYNYSFQFKKMKLKKGTQLFEKGDESNDVFLVKRGEVEIYVHEEDDGMPIKIALLSKGQIFGEEASEFQVIFYFAIF